MLNGATAMFTSVQLTADLEALRIRQGENEAACKANREAFKQLTAERDQIVADIGEIKKARFAAIHAEEKAAKIAALRAELAKLEAPDTVLSLVA